MPVVLIGGFCVPIEYDILTRQSLVNPIHMCHDLNRMEICACERQEMFGLLACRLLPAGYYWEFGSEIRLEYPTVFCIASKKTGVVSCHVVPSLISKYLNIYSLPKFSFTKF